MQQLIRAVSNNALQLSDYFLLPVLELSRKIFNINKQT